MLDGYLKMNDVEIINHARLQEYIDSGLVGGFEHIEACGCPALTARSLSPCCLNVAEGANASTPDAAGFAVGSSPIVLSTMLSSATLLSDGVLMSQWVEPANRGWVWLLRSDGHLSFRASADGTATSVVATSSAAVPLSSDYGVRVAFDPSDGAGGWTADFYYRPLLSNIWVSLGVQQTGTPNMTVFNSTAPVRIGAAG